MNASEATNHVYIDTPEGLQQFFDQNKNISWLGFDTEFVGERTYFPILCLLQVATEHGNYLIDPKALEDIGLFLEMVQNPAIVKITHAGENDYRLLFQEFGILPVNVYDTQIAAGFIGYNYPISFANLLQGELRVNLDKGPAVSDWESRPISKKQLQYALNDVIYLERLWKGITKKLEAKNRENWVTEEFNKLQTAKAYETIPNKEFLASSLLPKINVAEKLFLMRLYQWRIDMAEKKNKPKERVLQKKLISHIVKGVKGGKSNLHNNRLIPPHIIDKDGGTFVSLYTQEESPEEKKVLDLISNHVPIKPRIDAVMDILYLGIKIICSENRIAPELVIDRSRFKQMKWDLPYFDESLDTGWRKELLGDNVINGIKNRTKLMVDTKSEFFGLKM
ncbi:MAG: ribonuclease D [Salibacteraceae bacterium]|jgi:ribonuclease D